MIICSDCGFEMPEGTKFCPHCGTKIAAAQTIQQTIQLRCKSCSGVMKVEEGSQVLACPYCGSKELIKESDDITIERIKSKTYKDVEFGKQQIEREKLKLATEKEQLKREEESLRNFKKSKFRKVLVVFTVIALLMCCGAFHNGRIFAGIIAVIMAALFIVSFLMGMQVIKEKRRNFHILPAILAFVLLIPYVKFSNANTSSKMEKYRWTDIVLCDVLPEPESNLGEIYYNSGKMLSIEIHKVSEHEYRSYVEQCKEEGFTVESEQETDSFEAYNKEGYKLQLSYYKSKKELDISLEAPMEMTEFQWPDSALVKLLPVPESGIGKISSESSGHFSIYVGETTLTEFNKYVSACSEKGFRIDYKRGDDFYYADNEDGYSLSLKYEGNSIMYVSIKEPSSDESAGSVSEDIGGTEGGEPSATTVTVTVTPTQTLTLTPEPTPTLTPTPKATPTLTPEPVIETGVTPEFKEAMDRYEKFFDEYIAFMKKYEDSDNTVAMLADYAKYMYEYAEIMDKLTEIDMDELSAADKAYYLEVYTRINKKLLDAVQ